MPREALEELESRVSAERRKREQNLFRIISLRRVLGVACARGGGVSVPRCGVTNRHLNLRIHIPSVHSLSYLFYNLLSRPYCPGDHHFFHNTIAVRGEKCMCVPPIPSRCDASPTGGESARASKRPKRCERSPTAGVSGTPQDGPALPP